MSKVKSIFDRHNGTTSTKLDEIMTILTEHNRVVDITEYNTHGSDERVTIVRCKAISDLSVLSTALIEYGVFIYALNTPSEYNGDCYKIHLKDLP